MRLCEGPHTDSKKPRPLPAEASDQERIDNGVTEAASHPVAIVSAPSVTAAVSSSPIRIRSLQCRWCRPYELFELPPVDQPVPVGIFRGRCGERIGLIGVAVTVTVISRRRRLWRGSRKRVSLRPD